MRCLACAEHIPFWGENCPFCGEEKTRMQAIRILGLGFVLAGVIIGAVRDGWFGAIAVGLAGGIMWVCIEVIWDRLVRKRKRKKK